MPGAVGSGETMTMTLRFTPAFAATASALLEIQSNDRDEPQSDVVLRGNGGALPAPGEMWIPAADIVGRPMSGKAWAALKTTADGDLGTADLWWAAGDDTWVPWVINSIYGTSLPVEPANIGKCMGWTDWTHAP